MLPERVGLDALNDVAFEPSSNGKGGSPWGMLSEVEMKPIRFLEKPLWQAGAFHLLVGEKGCGKGTYLAHLAARFTRGELGPKRMVIWVAAGEDSLSLDVKPRIVVAGGDPGFVVWPRERLLLPSCVQDIVNLGRMLGDVACVLLDPLAGLFDSRRSSNHDADIRETISPLNQLADELDCLVIGVRHLGKDRSRGALASILGGVDWINVPRAVVGIGVDESDVRHIQVMAGNRSARSEGQAFVIEGAYVDVFEEPVTLASFTGASGQDVTQLLEQGPTSERKNGAAARELLLDILDEEGEQESDEITARVAQQTGLAAKTVKNIKTELKDQGLVHFRAKEKTDEGKVLRWTVYRSLATRPGRGEDTPGTLSGHTRDTQWASSEERAEEYFSSLLETPANGEVSEVASRERARSTGLNPRDERSTSPDTLVSGQLATNEYVGVQDDIPF